jgi:hypothetical protein
MQAYLVARSSITIQTDEMSALTNWLISCGVTRAEAVHFARPLSEQKVGTVKKALSLHRAGKLEAALMAAGIDQDDVIMVLEELSK